MIRGQYAIYKGLKGTNGACQFKLGEARPDPEGKGIKNGAIFVEAAATTGKNVYDWTNKITFAIGPNDIPLILNDPNGEFKLTHKYGGMIKTMEVKAGESYGFFLSFSAAPESGDGNRLRVSMPLSQGELLVLRGLIQSSMPDIIGWRLSVNSDA